MRKHFLILMLLALLPLAGFAADLRTVEVLSPYFGYAPSQINVFGESSIPLKEGTDYTFDGYFEDEACTKSISEANIAKKDAGTPLYAKVTGINGYEGYKVGSFEIKPMPLTITLADAYSKTFGAKDPTFVISTIKDIKKNDLTAALKSSVTISRDGGEDAGSYDYTATVSNGNYTFGEIAAQFVINPKDISGFKVTIVSELTYNGKEQLPTVTVEDGKVTLVPGETGKNDYTINYAGNKTSAGDQAFSITGNNNYTGTILAQKYTIAQAPLFVTPSSTKEYDGDADPITIKYAYQGFVDAKTADAIDASLVTCSTTAKKDVDSYALTIDDATKFSITDDNYKFVALDGTFKITKKEITVTPDDVELKYGDPENFTVKSIATPVAGEGTAVENAVKVVKGDLSKTKGHETDYELIPQFKTDAEIEAALKGDDAAIAAAKAATNNYSIKDKVVGYLTYTKAPLYIALDESEYTLTKVYDGKDISLSLNKDALIINGKKSESDVIDLSGLTMTIEKVNNQLKNAGTYNIYLTGAVADNYAITYIPSQYKITPKDLTVATLSQVFIREVSTAEVDQDMYLIDPAELAEGDKASEIFKLKFNATVTADIDGTKFKATAAAKYANAIEVVASDADATKTKWGNYTVITADKKTKESFLGDVVTVAKADAIVLDDTKDLTTVLTADKDDAIVTFNDRTLNAEQWNVLVLPFEISVKDLSTALGYAVIDVLDENASDGNAHFRLKVAGTIAANTPFLVYPSGDVKNLNSTMMGLVDVKKQTKATVSVADQGGVKFVGTYATTGVYGKDYWYMSKGTWYDASKYTESKKCNIKPLRAYLDMSGSTSAAPMIYIEEPDGNVTAIDAVSAGAKVANNNDAIYNLAGQKVGADYKGIVIKNGKRFVQK